MRSGARLATLAVLTAISFPAFADPLPAGFTRLADVDPTIRQDIR
ncbi:D-alanyl-D-alanine dipeptidase, partial [Mesorhizobium sp. M8A.F.Ca.ET.173.01.1.1]